MSECTDIPTSELPVSTVFIIPELLEPILLCLDVRTLLTSVRVCRRWRDMIQGSTPLQRALFFECEEMPAGSHEVTFNPLLVEMFPLLFNFSDSWGPHDGPRGFTDLAIEALPIGQRRVAFYRLDASWRRMHMRKPPVKYAGLWTDEFSRRRGEQIRLVKYEGGLRMEGLYFLVLKHVYTWDLSVKWGEAHARQLQNLKQVRRALDSEAEEIITTADVIIAGLCDEDSTSRHGERYSLPYREQSRRWAENERKKEEEVRKSIVSNGLVKMGIFWFKVRKRDPWEVMWRKWDARVCCMLHGELERLPYNVPL